MVATFKVRDPITGSIVVDETMLLTRYLGQVEVPLDTTWRTFISDGFLSGRPFYYALSRHAANLDVSSTNIAPQVGTVEVEFIGNTARYRMRWWDGSIPSDPWYTGETYVVFGVY